MEPTITPRHHRRPCNPDPLAAIIPDWNESVFARVKSFLEAIGYEGVANFDMKYDERDGEYKLFEINLRQGRSSYFVTLNGHNLAACFVDDLVEDTPFDGETLFARGDRLWLQVPRGVFRDYVAPGSDRNQALEMLREGRWGSTLRYRKDCSLRRWLMLRHMDAIYTKRYARFFRRKADMG